MSTEPRISCDNTECIHSPEGTCIAPTVNLQMTWIGSIQHWKLKCNSFAQVSVTTAKAVYSSVPSEPGSVSVSLETPPEEQTKKKIKTKSEVGQ